MLFQCWANSWAICKSQQIYTHSTSTHTHTPHISLWYVMKDSDTFSHTYGLKNKMLSFIRSHVHSCIFCMNENLSHINFFFFEMQQNSKWKFKQWINQKLNRFIFYSKKCKVKPILIISINLLIAFIWCWFESCLIITFEFNSFFFLLPPPSLFCVLFCGNQQRQLFWRRSSMLSFFLGKPCSFSFPPESGTGNQGKKRALKFFAK